MSAEFAAGFESATIDVRRIEDYERVAVLTAAATEHLNGDTPYDQAYQVLALINSTLCETPLSSVDIVRILNRVYKPGNAAFRSQRIPLARIGDTTGE